MVDPDIQNPLRDLTQEITRQYISQIVKESTKQAIRKQGMKLSQSQFHKLEEKISNLSDKQKLETMKEPLNEVKETLTTQKMGEKTLDKLSDSVSRGFETKMAVGMAVGVKVGLLAAIFIIGIFAAYILMFSSGSESFLSMNIPGLTVGCNTCSTCKTSPKIVCTACNGAKEVTCQVCGGDMMINERSGIDHELLYDPCTCEDGLVPCENCGADGFLDQGDRGYTV
jgi:hypothetical protein